MAVIISNPIQFSKEPYIDDVGPRKIKSMKFSVFSGSEINKAAEVQVWSSQYYDQQRLPVRNGLLDPRMGAANKNGTCATCHGNFEGCPGHFGHVKLCLPVFNLGYFGTILNVLMSICKSCARILLLDKDRMNYLKKMRNPRMEVLQKEALFKQVIKKCKATCSQCECSKLFKLVVANIVSEKRISRDHVFKSRLVKRVNIIAGFMAGTERKCC